MTAKLLTGILHTSVGANQDVIHLPEPSCYIEYDRMVDECTYSMEVVPKGQISSIVQEFNGSEGVWNNDQKYVNISVNYPSGFHGMLQVAVLNQFTLQIDLRTSRFRNNHPFTLKVFHLPSRLIELNVQQLASYITEDPCHHLDTMNECSILISHSKLSMKSNKNSIELKLNYPFKHALKVELYGRLCQSSCDTMYPSCPTNLTSLHWLNPMVELIINDLKPANYCAKVIYNADNQDCCSIFTRTVSVDGALYWSTHSAHNFHLSTFFYMVLAVLLLLVVVTGLIHLQYCWGVTRHLSMNEHEHISKENTKLVSNPKLDTQEIEMLLLYPKKEKLFMDTMVSFRMLLKGYTKHVWDPLDSEQIEQVVRNPSKWLQRVLMIPHLKIVLVETDEAVTWFNDDYRTLDVSDEDFYYGAISFIHNQPDLIFNYQRLLVIRFDYFKTHTPDRLIVVPQKRYNMPHQLGLLIMDIINSHEYAFDYDHNPHETVNQFYRLTEEYQRLLKTRTGKICSTSC